MIHRPYSWKFASMARALDAKIMLDTPSLSEAIQAEAVTRSMGSAALYSDLRIMPVRCLPCVAGNTRR